jgi:ribonuclease D
VVQDEVGMAAMLEYIQSHGVKLLGVDVEYSKADTIVNRDDQRWKAEFQNDKNQSSVVCSLQLCALGRLYFIDWTLMTNRAVATEILRLLLEDASYLKLFHGCQMDLSIIFASTGIVVRNIFDTARAYSDTHSLQNLPGLGALSEKVLGIPLDKAFQKSNWKIRPLPEEMLEYALTDAAILIPLYLELLPGLDAKPNLALENWLRVNSLEKNVCKGRPVYEIV